MACEAARYILWSTAIAACCVGLGCAPTLSTFTPAHVAKAGHVQMETGNDLSIPSGAMNNLVETGEAAAKSAAQNQSLTEVEQRDVLNAAAAVALNPPSMNSHLGVGVGILANWEVSGRLVSGGWRLGSRYELLHQDGDDVALSIGLGVGHYSWATAGLDKLNDVSEALGLNLVRYNEYSRWQFDLPVLVGKSGSWYRWWTGPKILFCTYDTSLTITPGGDQPAIAFGFDGLSTYFGLLAGAAIGYKYVFFATELTVMRFDTKAHFAATAGSNATAYDAKVGGLVIYPGFGLLGEF